jgi:hypothetical protein
MLAIICRCCGQPGLVLQAQAGRFFGIFPECPSFGEIDAIFGGK